jgi:hypothetical protein
VKASDLIAALDLPRTARVDQRVPKKLLVHHAPTAGDRRRVTEGIDEVQWIAALKPMTTGVPLFRDEVREYLEIAVLSATLRDEAKGARIIELVHRAVPYPVVLITEQRELISFSLAHKRWSQAEAGATVLEGDLIAADITAQDASAPTQRFRDALALRRQPPKDMYTLYQGWMDTLAGLLAARLTGVFTIPVTPMQSAARIEALRECARLDDEIERLRAAAERERQLRRRVELNLELKRVERDRIAAAARL